MLLDILTTLLKTFLLEILVLLTTHTKKKQKTKMFAFLELLLK